MTVYELIQQLTTFDADSEVFVNVSAKTPLGASIDKNTDEIHVSMEKIPTCKLKVKLSVAV